MSKWQYKFIFIIILISLSRWTNGSTNFERLSSNNELMKIILAYVDVPDYAHVACLNSRLYERFYRHLTPTLFARYQHLVFTGPMTKLSDLLAAERYVVLLRRALLADPAPFIDILGAQMRTNLILFTGRPERLYREGILTWPHALNEFCYSPLIQYCHTHIASETMLPLEYDRLSRQLTLYQPPFRSATIPRFSRYIRLPEVLVFVNTAGTDLRKEVLTTWFSRVVNLVNNDDPTSIVAKEDIPSTMIDKHMDERAPGLAIEWINPAVEDHTYLTYFNFQGFLYQLDIKRCINQEMEITSWFKFKTKDYYCLEPNMPKYLNTYSSVFAFYYPDFFCDPQKIKY